MKYRLTPREYQVASLIAADMRYAQIAQRLKITSRLVTNYAIKCRKKTSSKTDLMLINKFNAGEISSTKALNIIPADVFMRIDFDTPTKDLKWQEMKQ